MLGADALEHPDRAPEVWAVLTTRTATLDQAPFYAARKQVLRALRRRWPDAGYACVLEYTTGYGARSGGERRPHWNMILKGIRPAEIPLAAPIIRRVWCQHVDAEPFAQSVEPIWEVGGLAGYLAAHVQKESQKPPEGFKGQRFNCSRDYFEDRTRAEMRALARERISRRLLLWRATEIVGLEGEEAQAWADAEYELGREAEWMAVTIGKDGRIGPLDGPRQARTNTDDGGRFHSPLEAYLRMTKQLPSAEAVKYAKTFELTLDQLRWCDACGIVAPAIDEFQRKQLDEVGFDRLCPDCRAVIDNHRDHGMI